VIISDPVAHAFDERVFPGGLTYSGHPLAAASIVAALTAMEDEGVVQHAAQIGAEHLAPGLAALADKHELVGEVRGIGVFWAIELVSDRAARTPLDTATMALLKSDLVSRGLLPFTVDNRIHVVPPAVVTAQEIEHGLDLVDQSLTALRS
jgi:taurine--2-oxoglutarate transaminase